MIRQPKLYIWLFLLIFSILSQLACSSGEGGTGTPKSVTISWNANHETAVNAPGGGYKVYYSSISGFDIADPDVSVVDVPFVAAPAAPTSISLQLVSGQHYFRVVAYSALNSPWGTGGSSSAPSAQLSLRVP